MEGQPAKRGGATAYYSAVKVVAWVVLALAVLAIGYTATQSFINWNAIHV